MTKSELQNGDFVKTRAGNIFVVIDNNIYCFEGQGGWNSLDTYDEELKNINGCEELDIMAVRDFSLHSKGEISDFLKSKRSILWDWQREEKPKEVKTGRVTLDNIEKGEAYWYINDEGMSTSYYFANDDTDRNIINNSHFRAWYTKEEAIEAYDRYKAGEQVKDLIAKYIEKYYPDGWTPDYEEKGVMVLVYTPKNKHVYILRTYLLQTTPEWGFPEEMYHDKEFLEEVEEPFTYYVTRKKKEEEND